MTTYISKIPLSETAGNPWQKVLNHWTEDCLQCLWPNIHKKIDWQKPIEQLKWTAPEASQGTDVLSHTDLVYKVFTSEQKTCLLWIHLSFQQEPPETLAAQLFQLSHQLYTYYQEPILPLVIALKTDSTWQPIPYQAVALGYSTHRFEFQTVQLNDWLGKEDQLLSSNHLFEKIIAIHLRAQEASDNPEERYQIKLKLHGDLLKKISKKDDFLDLYTFMDQCIPLPKTFHKRYYESVYELERKKQVDYLISTEQFGIDKWVQKGYQKGVEEANRQHIQRMLFAGIDRSVIKSILRITDTELNRLLILENSDPKNNHSFETSLEH